MTGHRSQKNSRLGEIYGRGRGVGRGLAAGPALGVGVGRGVAVVDPVAVGVGVAVAVGEAHSPIANLFRCYFAILTTGAEAVLVADAARPCVLQPQGDRVGPSQRRYLAARRHRTGWKK
jgi:hypothetical protein